MFGTRVRRCSLTVLTAAIVVAGTGLAMASAPQSRAASWRPGQAAGFGPGRAATSASLQAVAATSARNAWAVGTLILHWDGHKWRIQHAAKTAGCRTKFWAVTSRSTAAAWAVGTCSAGARSKAIIEHWDGRRWTVQRSPSVPGVSELLGIKAISRSDAWAVGAYQPHTSQLPLIEHWNGHAWKLQHPAGAGPHGAILTAVTAVSATDAWAVGYALSASDFTTALIERWNGHTWRVQPSFSPGSQGNFLYGVAATSAKQAWVSGLYTSPGLADTLAEGWDGTMWLVQSTEDPAPNCFLYGMAARSASDVWAVGGQFTGGQKAATLILHWDGMTWGITASPDPPSSASILTGVAAVSGSDGWAVGSYGRTPSSPQHTLIERWNGHSWKIQASPS